MKYTLTILGFLLVVILIMTLSPAQSMEMTTSHELAESGIMIDFEKIAVSSSTPPTFTGVPRKVQTGATPPAARIWFELAESGQVLVFPAVDDPTEPAPYPNRTIAKPYVETPAPLAGTPYHRRHTFEMAESGQTIVFYEIKTTSPEAVDHNVVVGKKVSPTTSDIRQVLEPHVN